MPKPRSRCILAISLITLALLLSAESASAQSVAELRAARQSVRALAPAAQAGDWPTVARGLEAAVAVQPHPVWLYNLACALARMGNASRALAILDTLAMRGYAFDAGTDDDLASLHDNSEFKEIVKRLAANHDRIGNGTPIAQLEHPDFLPEGIAYDAATKTLFLSSVHERRVVRIQNGKPTTLADSTNGLWGVLGMTYAPRTKSLWLVTTAVAEMIGGSAESKGTALVELDARTGVVRRRMQPTGDNHSFNDLTVDANGHVFVSDAVSGEIYEWSQANGLRVLTASGAIFNPSGLALMPGSDWLYVADYVVGITRVSKTTGKVERLSEAGPVSTYGVDGLIRDGHDLIAIQNGLGPYRVMRLKLHPSGDRIVATEILERSNPFHDEPTLGVIVDGSLLYVANSRWNKFKNGQYAGPADAAGPVVLRLPLH